MSATMMISCPSCSIRYDLPAQRLAADGTVIKCASCGYSWLESRAIEITSVNPQQLPAVIDHDYEPDHEVRRLVEANRVPDATGAWPDGPRLLPVRHFPCWPRWPCRSRSSRWRRPA
jgi:predicted Zn finger-like uncharacterized protein